MHVLTMLAAAITLMQAPALSTAEQLQEAARKGDAVAVKKLLDAGVDVNTKFRYGTTALFYACDHGHLEVVKVLLDKGADLTIKDSFYGFTPLMLAVSPAQKRKPEHTEIAKLLIAKGAPGKEFALSGAIDAGDAALAKFILDSGGLPASTLSQALEGAKAANKTDIVTLLEAAGVKVPEEFKIDPAQLQRFAGLYKSPTNGFEQLIAVTGEKLTIGRPGIAADQRDTLAAKDATTFRTIGMGSVTLVFKLEGEKVTGFSMVPPEGSPVPYARVESK
jgi:Ankyrin repeats (3 copies)